MTFTDRAPALATAPWIRIRQGEREESKGRAVPVDAAASAYRRRVGDPAAVEGR